MFIIVGNVACYPATKHECGGIISLCGWLVDYALPPL